VAPERTRRFADELLAIHPDAVFAFSSIAVAALQRESRTVPIVFTAIISVEIAKKRNLVN
jgi:hypothetical protein